MTTNRREFLTAAAGSATLVSLACSTPSFLLQTARAANANRANRVLVVIQLSGGNDGLNTVIPYGDDEYYRNRYALAIGKNNVLKIDDYVGFHPSAAGLHKLHQEGSLAVVQGVGYENPNRSHFESMDLWHTAHLKENDDRGWLGRHLDRTLEKGGVDLPAVFFGSSKQPLALAASRAHAPSLASLDAFRLTAGLDSPVANTARAALNETRRGDDLEFIRQSEQTALATAAKVEEAIQEGTKSAEYPQTTLGRKLKQVAQLIGAGLQTPVYYVTLDGFDTHSNQPEAHAALLRELGDAMLAFQKDLTAREADDRVLTMAFSEFGRRVKENASQGTDHGAAAPLFLAGSAVTGGLVGKHPSMTDLNDGDLKFHTDYRRVYASVLEDWFGAVSEPVLGDQFKPLTLFS